MDRIFGEIFWYYLSAWREERENCFYLVLNVNILTVRVLPTLKRIELIKIWIHSIQSLQLLHIKYQDKQKLNNTFNVSYYWQKFQYQWIQKIYSTYTPTPTSQSGSWSEDSSLTLKWKKKFSKCISKYGAKPSDGLSIHWFCLL